MICVVDFLQSQFLLRMLWQFRSYQIDSLKVNAIRFLEEFRSERIPQSSERWHLEKVGKTLKSKASME